LQQAQVRGRLAKAAEDVSREKMEQRLVKIERAGFLALLYRGVIEPIVDRLAGRLPEATPLLEEARH
jgi:hypothetical protein